MNSIIPLFTRKIYPKNEEPEQTTEKKLWSISNPIKKSISSMSSLSSISSMTTKHSIKQIVPEMQLGSSPKMDHLSKIEEIRESRINSYNSFLYEEEHKEHFGSEVFLETLLDSIDETELEHYDFYCQNVSENLNPYMYNKSSSPKINNTNRTYHTHSISTPNLRSYINPQINYRMTNTNLVEYFSNWEQPKIHGLENSTRIIPEYYLNNPLTNSFLLSIDYLMIIKDDIRNYRKLNPYQIQYIQSLDTIEKNNIIQEMTKATNTLIDALHDSI